MATHRVYDLKGGLVRDLVALPRADTLAAEKLMDGALEQLHDLCAVHSRWGHTECPVHCTQMEPDGARWSQMEPDGRGPARLTQGACWCSIGPVGLVGLVWAWAF